MNTREFKTRLYDLLRDHNVPVKECIAILKALDEKQLLKLLKIALICFIPLSLSSCATTAVEDNGRYGFFPKPGMAEDSQDRNNTKYNLMDSPDGRKDPNAKIKVWGATY
jgi:hypothetical protein